jgi:hypothetical protein
VQRLVRDGRLHRRTVLHREPSNDPEVVAEYAREVAQFLSDARIELRPFLRELGRVRLAAPKARPRPPRAVPAHSQGMSGMKSRARG